MPRRHIMPLMTIQGPRLTVAERLSIRNMALVIEERDTHARKLSSFIDLHAGLAKSQPLPTRCRIGESLTALVDHAEKAGRICPLDAPSLRELVASTLDS